VLRCINAGGSRRRAARQRMGARACASVRNALRWAAWAWESAPGGGGGRSGSGSWRRPGAVAAGRMEPAAPKHAPKAWAGGCRGGMVRPSVSVVGVPARAGRHVTASRAWCPGAAATVGPV